MQAAAGAAPVKAPAASLPGDQATAFVFLDIVLILIAARLVGGLFVKLKQPRVVGEIVAGVLLGPSLFGVKTFGFGKGLGVLACDRSLAPVPALKGALDKAGVALLPGSTVPAKPSISGCLFPAQSLATLAIVGSLALALFMFLVGLELDFDLLKGKWKGIGLVGLGAIALPVVGGFLIMPALYSKKFVGNWGVKAVAAVKATADKVAVAGNPGQPSRLAFALMVGAMLAVTAFPVAVRILQEKGVATTRMGAVGVAAAGLVTILMFLLVGVARGVATKAGGGAQGKRFLGLIILIVVLWFVVRPLLESLFAAKIRDAGKLSGEAFAIFLIVLMATAYLADRIGVNVIVGGFLAGLVMPEKKITAKELNSRLSDFTIIILLPVFLAVSGLRTDFTKLGKGWIAGLVLFIVVGIVSKWAAGLGFAKAGGMTTAEGNVLGILMNCRGLLVLVVALIALDNKVITPQLQVGAVLMALISTAMTGPLIDKFLPKALATSS